MAETDGAWWSEVEHLREGIERRRAEESESTGFDRVAHRATGRFVRRQDELTSAELVDAELADLASPAPRARDAHPDPDAPPRTGRFDRGAAEGPVIISLDDDADLLPAPGPAAEPISPATLLSLDVGWQDPVREEERGEFTELIIPGQGVPGRPTVRIRGRGAEARVDALLADTRRRRPPRTVSERLGPRPDRVALWALLLALVLIVTAVATADASTLPS
jgi:hypothetical protein